MEAPCKLAWWVGEGKNNIIILGWMWRKIPSSYFLPYQPDFIFQTSDFRLQILEIAVLHYCSLHCRYLLNTDNKHSYLYIYFLLQTNINQGYDCSFMSEEAPGGASDPVVLVNYHDEIRNQPQPTTMHYVNEVVRYTTTKPRQHSIQKYSTAIQSKIWRSTKERWIVENYSSHC